MNGLVQDADVTVVFPLHLTVSFVLKRTQNLLLDAASVLELDVNGVGGLRDDSHVDVHSIAPEFGVEGHEEAAQLPLKGLVEVEVNERVVDVGALGEESRENETLRSHVPVIPVENEQEGNGGVRRPGDHEAQADAEEHLKTEKHIS